MAKSELGTKRLCPNCGAKYYDLGRDPVICPKCGASFATGLVAARPEPKAAEADDAEDLEDDVELVPLESAEESEEEGEDVEVGADVLEGVGEDLGDNDAFIAEDDEEDDVEDVVRGDVAGGEDEDR